jgi:23S rRNA pseudouridine1911/1915/1917 synthase
MQIASQIRLDILLTQTHDNLTRSHAQKLIRHGNVKINNKTVTKPGFIANIGDSLIVNIPENQELNLTPEDIPLDIVYEDSDLLVINKPKNMVIHPAAGNHSGTLVNALLACCKDSLSGINGVSRPGIVHRIDKNTSGLLLVAKNDIAHNSLAEQIKNHSLTRAYLAITLGNVESQIIDKPIGRDPKHRKKQAIVPNGKPAVTVLTPLSTLQIKGKTCTLVKCVLKTGRTHQIRVHLSSIGHPILGDDTYGNKNAPAVKSQGQLLHAFLLGFIHPKTHEYMEFSSLPPTEFLSLLPKSLKLSQLL